MERIVEQKSLRGRQAEQREINSGIYAFATAPLYRHIGELKTDNAHQEYYLTDMAEAAQSPWREGHGRSGRRSG